MAESSPEDEVKPAAGAGSAEERCPICLEDYNDKAFIDACFHAFCFGCIVKAVEMTTGRCPMCKATFDTVIHNVRAIDDYDRYKVQPKPTTPPPPPLLAMQEEAFRTFRGYRTTRLPGQSRPQVSSVSTSIDRTRHTTSSATVPVGSSSSSQALLSDPSKSSHSRKRTSSQFGKQSRKPAALERRRAVYSAGLRALPIEASDSRRIRVRDISASFFRKNPASTHRLFPWLTREFKVLVGDEHVEFMLQLMQSLIDKIDLESAEFGSHLEPFLHEKTQLFMHELVSFAKSPYNMIAYDSKVKYDWPETHPQAQKQSSGGNTEEITDVGSQPGPSGIQQRVLEELMLSRWDNSPPLHSGSQSPAINIVIQDSSDSEPDLYPEHTASPSSRSQLLATEANRETTVEQSGETAQLTAPSNSLGTTQSDVQASTSLAAIPPNNPVATQGNEQCSANLTTTSDSLITTRRDVQTSTNAPTESQEQVTLTRTSVEAISREEHGDSASTLVGTSHEHMATIDSCPEVSSSSATLVTEKPVPLNNEVSSTSENLEVISQPSSSAAMEYQPRSDMLPNEEATTLVCLRDQVQIGADDDDDFEISLYAEDGGASLGEGSTPSSEILKKSRKDRDKSSRVSELKKMSRHGDGHSREKEHTKSRSRYSESKSSSGSGQKGHESRSRDRERHHRHSHHRRSRSRSHSRSRSYRSHRRDSTEEYNYSRSRHHRSRSREREYSHKRKSYRSRSRSVSRPRYSRSCSSNDNDTSSRIKSTVVAKNRDREERKHRSRHCHERQRRERSESRSPHRHTSSHYRGEHDYERRTSNDDREHQSRGRLYSDDVWSEELHSQQSHSSSNKSVRHSTHSSQGKMKQRSANETKLLAQELNEVDRQIQDNKKELLKSMLRKERLELLQKNLHGGESSVVDVSSVLQQPTDVGGVKSTSEMEEELELLNRAIVDGKKQLLRVMKKMEEEQIELNQD